MLLCAILKTYSKENATSKSSEPNKEQTGISTNIRESSGEYVIPRRSSIPYCKQALASIIKQPVVNVAQRPPNLDDLLV